MENIGFALEPIENIRKDCCVGTNGKRKEKLGFAWTFIKKQNDTCMFCFVHVCVGVSC